MGIFVRKLSILFVLLPVIFVSTGWYEASAGFGITPPYVKNTSLTRNSIYEQQILLVRGDPNVAQRAEVTIDAPGFEDWIQVVEGLDIPLPRGARKVPMTVRVTVPEDADFENYQGAIRIRTLPEDGEVAAGAVSISLGARVDIDLDVIDREIRDFRIRKVVVSDLNEGSKLAWLYFPGKIQLQMLLENTGNVPIAPSNVVFKIYDRSGVALLEETETLGRIPTVAPYAAEEIVAELPTRLPAGGYIARYQIFNDDQVVQEGDLGLTILPAGTLQTAGYGFVGLSLAHKVSVLLPVFAIIIIALYILYIRRKPRHVR
jgi:hypothetical protein